jgi:hypothetical protein
MIASGAMVWRLFGLAIALMVLVGLAGDAKAEPPGPRVYPVYVLTLDTDDVEDQAEALTGALRSRVRAAPGWSLSETPVTLSMLTAALKCPRVPDALCLSRIAEQIRADRFVWGMMSRGPGNTVRADLHLWSRNKPETHTAESYSDNLRDQNDDRLGRVAQRLFERLTGTVSNGTLVVKAGDGAGVVLVDGQRRAILEQGTASVDLMPGSHVVEVRVQGFVPATKEANVVAGKEMRVALTLKPVADEPDAVAAATVAQGWNGRKVAGWGAVGIGGALLVASAVEATVWLGKKSDGEMPRTATDTWKGDACNPTWSSDLGANASRACDLSTSAKNVSTLAWAFGAGGAAALAIGIYLVATDANASPAAKFEDRTAARSPNVRVVPALSPATQGLFLTGAF